MSQFIDKESNVLHAAFTVNNVNVVKKVESRTGKVRIKKSSYRKADYKTLTDEALESIKENFNDYVIIETGGTIQVYNRVQRIDSFDALVETLVKIGVKDSD